MKKKQEIRLSLIIIGLGSLTLLAVLFTLRGPVMERVNAWRAARLQSQAESAFSAGEWAEAARVGRAAHFLSPEDLEIELLVARALLQERSRDTVAWWERVVGMPMLPTGDLQELVRLLLNERLVETATPFMERLIELDAFSPETQQLWLRFLAMNWSYSEVYGLASALVDAGSDDWMVHSQYIDYHERLMAEGGEEATLAHLEKLITAGGPLALRAARELAAQDSATKDQRLLAATRLEELAEDDLDRLYAVGVQVKEGSRDASELDSLIDEILSGGAATSLEELMRWSIWMGEESKVLEKLSFEDYLGSGAESRFYFENLMRVGRAQDLLEIVGSDTIGPREDAAVALIYRAAALETLGDKEAAGEALALAVKVVDPAETSQLERVLLSAGRWELLLELYAELLRNDPDNAVYIQKNLAARYYLGDQTRLSQMLRTLDLTLFERNPGILGFIYYLKLVFEGTGNGLQQEIETYLARYPELFDFRLIAGLAYWLNGDTASAAGFLEGMPEMKMDAPRYLRVSAALLSGERETYVSPMEMARLLPREQFLISSLQD
jgi:tetratricopeptide (TPR) repeat protein